VVRFCCAVKLESTRGAERRAFLAAILSATILIWHPIIGPYILAACLFCFALRPVWYYLLGKGNPNRLALLLTVWVVLTGLSTFQGKMASTQNAVAAVVSQPDNIERETAQWIMQNTPTDAVFLIDPKWWNFRAISKRPAFVTWKDGSAILWDRSFVRPWTERLQALGLEISASGLAEGRADKQLGDLYKKLQDTEVEQLKSRYGMSYWIVRPDKQSQFPVVFQNRRHKVLRLE
jgi:hypothetical protein